VIYEEVLVYKLASLCQQRYNLYKVPSAAMKLSKRREQEKNDEQCIKEVSLYYKNAGRHDLVWRKNITPYRILVSEIMLQQTQVSRVLPKFAVWMNQYPTLTVLQTASLQDVLILWQGLGYQRRAKALLAIAKEHRVLPKTFDELLCLPGIGTYTASALCAFAYNTFSHPVLETNIRTVLIEFFHQGEQSIHDGLLYDDLSRLEKNKDVREMGARHWYYALMDFGAHLKTQRISHNTKSAHHTVQSAYKGSLRALRAETLFAIAHKKTLPKDERVSQVLAALLKEKFIELSPKGYVIVT
jgi:A/G-specific adenine glycosylase